MEDLDEDEVVVRLMQCTKVNILSTVYSSMTWPYEALKKALGKVTQDAEWGRNSILGNEHDYRSL